MKKSILTAILCTVICTITSLTALADVPGVQIPKVKADLVVDGRLREEAWWQAAVFSMFKNVMDEQAADAKSLVFMMYDDVNLYIGFKFLEEDVATVRSYQTQRDEPVFLDDSVELFLDLQNDGEDPYYHVIINADGTVYDEIGLNHPNWDLQFKYKSCRVAEEKVWNVEIVIPFASLNTTKPKPGTVWGLNLARNRYREQREHSAWALTPHNFHQPVLFGHLIFK